MSVSMRAERGMLFLFLCIPTAAWAAAPFADRVVWRYENGVAYYTKQPSVNNMTFGPFHANSNLWGENALIQASQLGRGSVLGKPNLLDKDDTVWGANSEFREINVVWPAWYMGTTQASAANTKYDANPTSAPKIPNGVGLRSGGQIVIEFDEPIYDDPYNPYGIDFIVHGNSFFAASGTVYKDTNMNEYRLTAFGGGGGFGASGPGAVFEERVTVSVAQSLDGPWYTYTNTFGDWYFPTQPLAWDRNRINPNRGNAGDWTDQEMDWTKPVNPALMDLAGEAAQAGSARWGYFGNRTVADALDLYAGSAGGTGFDLAPSGFAWIKYIKFTDPNNKQGEICGVVDAAPVKAGDRLTMTWHNVHETGQNTLYFQAPNDLSVNLAKVIFHDIDYVSYVSVSPLSDLSGYGSLPLTLLNAYEVRVDPVFPAEAPEVSYLADLSLRVADTYAGDGGNLWLLRWDGFRWDQVMAVAYDPATRMLTAEGLTSFSVFALAQVPEPSGFLLAAAAAGALAILKWWGRFGAKKARKTVTF